MNELSFLIGVIVGAAIAIVGQQLHWRMTSWERRNFSRHDERYTPERKQEEVE